MRKADRLLRDFLFQAGSRRSIVREQAAREIMARTTGKGQPLVEFVSGVVAASGVSESTVRRTILQMQRAGLVEVRQREGAFIKRGVK